MKRPDAEVDPARSATVPCAFCSKKATIGFFTTGEAIALHEMPPCPEYVAMDVLSFTVACRKAAEARAKGRPRA